MPMIAHPLICDQFNWIIFESLCNHTFKSFKVTILEKDVVAGVTTIKRVIDLASEIRTKCTGHGIFKKLRN